MSHMNFTFVLTYLLWRSMEESTEHEPSASGCTELIRICDTPNNIVGIHLFFSYSFLLGPPVVPFLVYPFTLRTLRWCTKTVRASYLSVAAKLIRWNITLLTLQVRQRASTERLQSSRCLLHALLLPGLSTHRRHHLEHQTGWLLPLRLRPSCILDRLLHLQACPQGLHQADQRLPTGAQ